MSINNKIIFRAKSYNFSQAEKDDIVRTAENIWDYYLDIAHSNHLIDLSQVPCAFKYGYWIKDETLRDFQQDLCFPTVYIIDKDTDDAPFDLNVEIKKIFGNAVPNDIEEAMIALVRRYLELLTREEDVSKVLEEIMDRINAILKDNSNNSNLVKIAGLIDKSQNQITNPLGVYFSHKGKGYAYISNVHTHYVELYCNRILNEYGKKDFIEGLKCIMAHELFHAIHCLSTFFADSYLGGFKRASSLWGRNRSMLTDNELKQIKEGLAEHFSCMWARTNNFTNHTAIRMNAWNRKYIDNKLRFHRFMNRIQLWAFCKKNPSAARPSLVAGNLAMWPYAAAIDLGNLRSADIDVWRCSIAKTVAKGNLVTAYSILTDY